MEMEPKSKHVAKAEPKRHIVTGELRSSVQTGSDWLQRFGSVSQGIAHSFPG